MTKPRGPGGSQPQNPSDSQMSNLAGKHSTPCQEFTSDTIVSDLELPSTTTAAVAMVTLTILYLFVRGCRQCYHKFQSVQSDIPSAVGQVRDDRRKRWTQRQVLLQIGEELTKEDVSSAKFLLRDDIARGKLEQIQSGRQLIMSLEKYSEKQQETTILVLVHELLQGLQLHPVINKYSQMFGETQQTSDSGLGGAVNQDLCDVTAEDETNVLSAIQETSGIGMIGIYNPPATEDAGKAVSVQCTDSMAMITERNNHTSTHAMAETSQQASLLHATKPDDNEQSESSQVWDVQCSRKSDESSVVTDGMSNVEQNSSQESPQLQGSRRILSSVCAPTNPQTRRSSEHAIDLFTRDRKELNGCQTRERSHDNFRLQCHLVQLLESIDVRFEDHWLAAEGPHYPLQVKYQASLREHLYARLPELLAAAGRTDGLEMYIQAYGQKTLMRRHTKTWTPLDWAASSGQLQCVEWLIKFTNRINLCHALLWAGQNGHIDVMQYLLQAGANLCFRHPTGDSVLHFASRCGRNKVIQFILRNANEQLDCDYQTFFGQYTPLHEAAANGQSCIVQLLLGQGANVNALSQMHETPLMLAVSQGERTHRHCMQILLQHGADAAIQDKDGKTVFDYAAEKPGCLLTLLQYGAIPFTQTEMQTVDRVITLELAKSLRTEIIPSIECQWCRRVQEEQPSSSCLPQAALQRRRQQAHHLLLQLREHEFGRHGMTLMWTCGALHLVETSLVGQLPGFVMMDVYLHLQFLVANMLQQPCWNPTPKTVLLFADKGCQFQLEG